MSYLPNRPALAVAGVAILGNTGGTGAGITGFFLRNPLRRLAVQRVLRDLVQGEQILKKTGV